MSDNPGQDPKDVNNPGQVPEPATPPADNAATPQDTFPREYVEELRGENAQRRKEAKALKDELGELRALLEKNLGVDGSDGKEAIEAALKQVADTTSKLDSLTAEVAKRDDEIQKMTIRAAIIAEAARAGIADPEDAVRLADLSEIQLNDAGVVEGAAEAVKALAEAKPYLLKTKTAPNPGPTNPAGGDKPGDLDWYTSKTGIGARGSALGGGGVIAPQEKD